MEFGVVVLVAGGKPENQEKNPRSKAGTNKLKPHMRPAGILQGPIDGRRALSRLRHPESQNKNSRAKH